MGLTLHTLDELPERAVLAVGTFDGVHLGHQRLLSEMRAFAATSGRPAWVLTFTGHPLQLLDPEHVPGRIQDELSLVSHVSTFVDDLILQPFTPDFGHLSASAFAERLRTCTVFCGDDWRFGFKAEGSPDFLKALGIDVRVVPYADYRGERISSSRIRAAMAEGQMDEVAQMLGRTWEFCGQVVHGRGLAGPTFGVPTLNLPYLPASLTGITVPLAPLKRGVYRATAYVLPPQGAPERFPAVANFGVAPSVKQEPEPLFEVHLLGAEGDFYGWDALVQIDTPILRSEQHFDSLEALKAQILQDREACIHG